MARIVLGCTADDVGVASNASSTSTSYCCKDDDTVVAVFVVMSAVDNVFVSLPL